MKSSINISELIKKINASRKSGRLVWTKEEQQHFITTGHWLIHFNDLPNPVLAALFGVFYSIPQIGETYVSINGEVNLGAKPINYKELYQPEKQSVVGEVTEYSRDLGNKRTCRVLKFSNMYSLVNSDYLKLVNGELDPRSSLTPDVNAIYFVKGEVVILPCRITEGKLAIEDLLGDELDEPVNPS